MRIITVDFNTTDPLLIIYSAFIKYLRKKREYKEAVHQLFIDCKNTCDSVIRAVFYNILSEFGIAMKLVRLKNSSIQFNSIYFVFDIV